MDNSKISEPAEAEAASGAAAGATAKPGTVAEATGSDCWSRACWLGDLRSLQTYIDQGITPCIGFDHRMLCRTAP